MKPNEKPLWMADRFRGCLLGGAAGDALGYEVEFLFTDRIVKDYGPRGITQYALHNGTAQISDDTQMTLFTANGLLVGETRGHMRGIMGPYAGYVAQAYREWYRTQGMRKEQDGLQTCWLMDVPQLYAARAPGVTCLSAIEDGCSGSIEAPINRSKGCGGVMRTAPVGLRLRDPLEACRVGAQVAALTHGHEMGYIPAGVLAHMVNRLVNEEEITLCEALEDALSALPHLFPGAETLPDFLALMEKAQQLALNRKSDPENIASLGQGWCGDEALAIAVYCALRYDDDFDRALVAAVNHDGDSDSTGAITGNLLGAAMGLSRIPPRYLENLEAADVIREMAEDLLQDCPISEYHPIDTPQKQAWYRKYVEGRRA